MAGFDMASASGRRCPKRRFRLTRQILHIHVFACGQSMIFRHDHHETLMATLMWLRSGVLCSSRKKATASLPRIKISARSGEYWLETVISMFGNWWRSKRSLSQYFNSRRSRSLRLSSFSLGSTFTSCLKSSILTESTVSLENLWPRPAHHFWVRLGSDDN